MNIWFLDDGTLGGNATDVFSDLEKLIPAMARIGLNVNPSKCQIIALVNGAPLSDHQPTSSHYPGCVSPERESGDRAGGTSDGSRH